MRIRQSISEFASASVCKKFGQLILKRSYSAEGIDTNRYELAMAYLTIGIFVIIFTLFVVYLSYQLPGYKNDPIPESTDPIFGPRGPTVFEDFANRVGPRPTKF